MNNCFIITKCIANIPSKCRKNTASSYLAHVALENPTTLPQRAFQHAVQNTKPRRYLCMFKIIENACRSMRWHSAHTALLSTARRAPRRSAFYRTLLERCKDATLV